MFIRIDRIPMHSIGIRNIIRSSLYLLILLFPSTIVSSDLFKTACELLKLPRDCHCQRTRGVPLSSLNETRLRCRQLTEVTTHHRWSVVLYDRLAFETPNDNLTLYPFAFADIRARTLRFDVQNLYLTDHTLDNAYIGQLAIARANDYGRIQFETNGQIFYGTTITNIFFKSIDFQRPISEMIFSNARVYSLLVQSSKFYGFTNHNVSIDEHNEPRTKNDLQHDNFLEYDLISSSSSSPSTPLKIRRRKVKKIDLRRLSETSDESSSQLSEQTIKINITAINLPASISLYTILASINTSRLSEHYFANNIDYSQTDEIELSYNRIDSIGNNAFRHLRFFEGRLILKYNQIKSLDRFAFAHLHSLNNLSLANNLIQHLTVEHFQDFKRLIELDLSFNRLEQLNESLFQSLDRLEILNLNGNPLKHLHQDLFLNLSQLKELHLEGVDLFQTINEQSMSWLWNLANFHGKNLLRTNLDLSDVAFCLLSRFNQTSYHLSSQPTCSCLIHYFSRQSSLATTNYLRLSPVCLENGTISSDQNDSETMEEFNQTTFLLHAFDKQCQYELIYLDCDSMTTTTTTEMTTIQLSSTSMDLISETSLPTTTPRYHKYTKPPKKSANNMKKLFTVLGTLVAITIAAIILVILWYRLKTIFKRRQKRKKLLEQQRRLNLLSSTTTNNNNNLESQTRSNTPRYASSDMLSSSQSAQLGARQTQSQGLIATPGPLLTVYRNTDALTTNSTPTDNENISEQGSRSALEINAITSC